MMRSRNTMSVHLSPIKSSAHAMGQFDWRRGNFLFSYTRLRFARSVCD
jgi:hypothetical protein